MKDPKKSRHPLCHVLPGRLLRSVCPISGFRSFTICLIREKTCGLRAGVFSVDGSGCHHAGERIFLYLRWNPSDPVREFDFLGITLQYEMCYTNVLQILDLSQGFRFMRTKEPGEDPIVIGGGPCAYNPEPMAPFFDMFYIGEGETVYFDLLDIVQSFQGKAGDSQDGVFKEVRPKIPGIYVPLLYDVTYHEDGTIASFLPNCPDAPEMVKKQLVMDMTDAVYPKKPLVPFMKVTQDRVVLEIHAWLYPWLPVLPGRNDLPADPGERTWRC